MDGQRDLFSIDIQYVKGVGPKRAELFSKLGIDSVGALLQFYPRAYIDLQQTLPLSQAPFDAPCAVLGRVVHKLPPARLGGGKTLYKLLATDFTQDFAVVFWQNRFPYESLKEGQDYLFYGKFGGTLTQREVNSPLFLPEGERRDLLPVRRYSGVAAENANRSPVLCTGLLRSHIGIIPRPGACPRPPGRSDRTPASRRSWGR